MMKVIVSVEESKNVEGVQISVNVQGRGTEGEFEYADTIANAVSEALCALKKIQLGEKTSEQCIFDEFIKSMRN